MALTVAAIQMSCGDDLDTNVDRAERLVRDAARRGATLILLPELFEGPYFCIDQRPEHFALARPADGHPTIDRFRAVAAELGVALPISFFERAGQAHYNSIAMIDADGRCSASTARRHIPDGPGYTEKYYFNPGDTGFRSWSTRVGRVGVGICWDQWFPEAARRMALEGAEVLLYPTAIGSEPPDPSWDSSGHWQRVMQGHAAANLMPLVAANRVGDGTGRARRDHVLRLLVHRRCHRREGGRGPAGGRGRADRDVRSRRSSARCAPRGACSAIAAPTCTARSATSDGHTR